MKLPPNCRLALRVPVALGLKFTSSVHVAPGAITPKPGHPPELKNAEKSNGFVPVLLFTVTVTETAPVLVIVKVCGVPNAPIS